MMESSGDQIGPPSPRPNCYDLVEKPPFLRNLPLSKDRNVPEELDDPRDQVESCRGMPLLPVDYRGGVNAKPLGNMLLEQTQIKALLADVVSDGVQCLRIDRGKWS